MFRLLDLPAVRQLVGISKTSIYTIEDFPRPVKIHGKNAAAQSGSRWVEAEVVAWIKSRIADRDEV